MNELALKLSEYLDITLESALELYPVLKGQFVAWGILNTLEDFLWGIVMLCPVIAFVVLMVAIEDAIYMEDSPKTIKAFVGLGITLVISLFGIVGVKALMFVFAPDFMLIKTLFK